MIKKLTEDVNVKTEQLSMRQKEHQEIKNNLVDEQRIHNETKKKLQDLTEARSVFDLDWDNLVEIQQESEKSAKIWQAAKGDKDKELLEAIAEHKREESELTRELQEANAKHEQKESKLTQDLKDVTMFVKNGCLIGYENKYSGCDFDKEKLVSFTDGTIKKFQDFIGNKNPPYTFYLLSIHQTILENSKSILSRRGERTLTRYTSIEPFIFLL
jgi:hypothetical protein